MGNSVLYSVLAYFDVIIGKVLAEVSAFKEILDLLLLQSFLHL